MCACSNLTSNNTLLAPQIKHLEQQLRNLQRECKESALEIQRLKGVGADRLPPLAGRSGLSLEDDLAHLKRFMAGHNAAGKAPPMPAVRSRGGSPIGSPTGTLRAERLAPLSDRSNALGVTR